MEHPPSGETHISTLKARYDMADTNLRMGLASFDGLIEIAHDTFDESIGTNKYSPEQIESRGDQINALFKKMTDTLEETTRKLNEAQLDRKSLPQTSAIQDSITKKIQNIERFLQGHSLVEYLNMFVQTVYFGPIHDESQRLLAAYITLRETVDQALQEEQKTT